MDEYLQLLLALAAILVAAKIGGYLSYLIGQPTVLGELIFGVILGPSAINLLHLSYFTNQHLTEMINQFAELGVLLLMFIAGLDLHLSDLAKTGKTAALSGSLGVIIPLFMGFGAGLLFEMDVYASIFLGLILAATSVSISAQTLIELKVLRSRVGMALLGAAVFDDILVILGLSIFLALLSGSSGHGIGSVIWIALRMALYLVLASAVGMLLLPRLSQKVNNFPISQGVITFTFVVILIFGWTAEEWGNVAAITGAFIAGLVMARSPVKERIESGISTLAYGLFVPIFFIDVGLKVNASELSGESLWLFLILTAVAITGKIIGAGFGALFSGLSRKEALQVGIGMVSRGEVGLIVASVGIANQIIPPELFAAVVGIVIVTTLITPPLLKAAFSVPKNEPKIMETDETGSTGKGELQ